MNNKLPAEIHSYLKEISERLWTGHASIMIGAGFSKNAINTVNSFQNPPNWWQLGDVLYEKLYNEKPDSKVKYLSLLKLAEEFEATFGRSALDNFISKSIADNEYEPSEIHKVLMELPWADVFTTNYDTLLERSCKDVFSRKYDVVINQNDLIYSNKPRIIKLHGSLPSKRPFIITEEDYRTYPQKFAPFINTVQQSLLENTLCLIGFSGDDPNFLQWVGWINDNLGKENSPKIYLVGVLNLSESQRKLLINKNIVTVDLSNCDGVNGGHQKGLEYFINYLNCQGFKRDSLKWPLSSDLKTLGSNNVNIKNIIQEWRNCREKYPNWIILPQEHRERLWMYTNAHSSNEIIFENLQIFEELDYIYELNWRLEKCLFPIWNNIVPFFQKILDRYNFFPNEILEEREVDKKNWKGKKIDWDRYKKYWINVSLAVLRFYREEDFDDKWVSTFNNLNLIKQYLTNDELSHFYYEQILNAIFKLKYVEAKKLIDEWPQNNISIFWNAKRAMLLTEFGQLKEAANLLESSLLEIRRMLNLSPIENNYNWVSQEAFVMFQLNIVQLNINIAIRDYKSDPQLKTENFSERWNDLLQFRCDPWSEKKYFDLVLQQPLTPWNSVSVKSHFEIGKNTKSYSIGKGGKDFIVAYTFLRYLEELAIPISLSASFNDKTINGVMERIKLMSFKWGIAILNRNRNNEVVNVIFNRKQLNDLPFSVVNDYVQEYLQLFKIFLPQRESNPIIKAFINKIPFIFARLCTKCNEELKIEIFKMYLDLSQQKEDFPEMDKLLKNLINSSNTNTLKIAAEFLITSPIFDSESSLAYHFIEPFDYFKINMFEKKIRITEDNLNYILEKADNNKGTRLNAIRRLMFLYKTGSLNKNQIKKVNKIIWNQIDSRTGFPKYTRCYNFVFVDELQKLGTDMHLVYRNYIENNNFNVQELKSEGGLNDYEDHYAEELIYSSKNSSVDLTLAELESILTKCEIWWNLDKHYIIDEKYKDDRFGKSVSKVFLLRFRNLVNVLSNVFGRYQNELDNTNKQRIKDLTKEIEKYGVSVLKIKVTFCFYNSYNEYLSDLKYALVTKDRLLIVEALESIILAVTISSYSKNIEFIHKLLNLMCIPLEWRILDMMGDVFNIMEDFIKSSKINILSINEIIFSSLKYIYELELEEDCSDFVFDDYLLLKQHSISLAGTIFKEFSDQSLPIPQIIMDWKALSENENEFADIRNKW